MYFIFERSKTPERKKGQNYNNEIFNLFKVTKKISIFTLKKFKQIKFLHAILKSCFLQEFAFFFSCIF